MRASNEDLNFAHPRKKNISFFSFLQLNLGLPGLPPRGLQDRPAYDPRAHLRLLGAGPGRAPHGAAGARAPVFGGDAR